MNGRLTAAHETMLGDASLGRLLMVTRAMTHRYEDPGFAAALPYQLLAQ
jgi:hypothetical protein